MPTRRIRAILKRLRVNEAIAQDIPYYQEGHLRVTYVRYADDFLIGLKGDKATARNILQRILFFVEHDLKMRAHPMKTGVKHRKTGVTYLGYNIWHDENASNKDRDLNSQRAKHTQMFFTIPIKKLYARYAEKGYFMKAGKGSVDKFVPRRLDKLVSTHPVLIIKHYNAVVRGLINYYRGSERLSDLYTFLYYLRRSAALTISHFYKKKSAKWAFDKYGKNLTIVAEAGNKGERVEVSFDIPSLEARKGKKR